ncbi:ProQ/FinO family protein [Paucibacter sp. AS339]|uniref:ProQ/FinO family protein n=1 Tax=Paucibacter hankyongi TaxID=3133434 RepID=UPI00309896B9
MNETPNTVPTSAPQTPAELETVEAVAAVDAVDNLAAAAEEAPAVDAVVPEVNVPAAETAAAKDMSPAACAAKLKELFPALFVGGGIKPLKLRVQADIQERAPGVFTKAQLSAFLRRHTGGTGYLLALSKAKHRFDLDGQPAGDLSDEHRAAAVEELTRRRGLQQERLQVEQQRQALEQTQARNRAGLLHDFERTTLTLPNFCALKGVTPEELPGLLDLARQEAAERAAQRPQFQAPREPRPGQAPRGERGRPDERRGRRPGPQGGRKPGPQR